VVNATGTFICAVEIAEYTPVYVSLHLTQEENNFTVLLVCLDSVGCRVKMNIYDYYNNTLYSVSEVSVNVSSGESLSESYLVLGRGVVELTINDVYLGHYVAQVFEVPTAVPTTLRDLAGLDPVLTAVIGLIVVGVPVGWLMQRELGLAGLALAGASMLIYVLVKALTGSDPVAITLACISALIGVVLLVMHGGSP